MYDVTMTMMMDRRAQDGVAGASSCSFRSCGSCLLTEGCLSRPQVASAKRGKEEMHQDMT